MSLQSAKCFAALWKLVANYLSELAENASILQYRISSQSICRIKVGSELVRPAIVNAERNRDSADTSPDTRRIIS